MFASENRLWKGPLCLFCAAILPVLCGAAWAADPSILYEKEAHVGEEVVLSVASIPSDASLEWAVSGNVNPILLRDGGRECAFTPVDTSPITVTANLRGRNGASLGSATQTIKPREFNVAISVVVDEPVELWNPIERADVPTDALLTNRPIHLRAKLEPAFEGEHSFTWTVDAATSQLEASNKADLKIQRGQTGDSEIFVTAFNAAGVRMGNGAGVVSVTLPLSTFEESERSRQAWKDWQAAQPLWEARKYAEAVELARKAQAAAPRDPDIANGFKAMSANYARYQRAAALRQKSAEERRQKKLEDALKDLRLAQVLWPEEDDAKTLGDIEKEVDAVRILVQKANWLRDTATAYDQEGMYEEALDYYAKSLAVMSSEAVKSRMERIRARLDLIAEADRYAGEGNALEHEGHLREAVEAYTASLKSHPDAALKQHTDELQNAISRREKQAANLYSEGMALERKGSDAEALQRYRDSNSLWETPGAQDRIEELEKTVISNAPVRKAEDFGIGTKADAARLVSLGDSMYLQRRLEDAVSYYRKSLSLSPSEELRGWISELEAILRDRKTSKAANTLIREGNALFRAGKTQEAAAKYRESLRGHPNAEVEAFMRKNGLSLEEEQPEAPKGKRKK